MSVDSHKRAPQLPLCQQIKTTSWYFQQNKQGPGGYVVTSRFHVCTIETRHQARRGQCVVTTLLLIALRHRKTSCLSRDLALDESKSLLPVFTSIALVCGGIVSVAAVRVSSVAVRLDLGGTRAREARGTGIELRKKVSKPEIQVMEQVAYSSSLASANLV